IYASGNLTAGTIKSNGTIESTGRIKAGEYLHLNGQATLNAKCTPNGLVGRDSTGRVLSCVNGKWQTASGDGLKGIFITITDQVSGYKCVIPNSDTGTCACPGSMYDTRYGFLSGTLIAEYDEQRCSGSKNEHCYSNYRRLYACR
ncbi:shufflon system plasmid conjugative transfer pilus tip adhesin PilV, partial [Escherichia coli]